MHQNQTPFIQPLQEKQNNGVQIFREKKIVYFPYSLLSPLDLTSNPMVPPHQSLIPPSQIRHHHTKFENFHPINAPVRTRPSTADLDEEITLSSDQSFSSSRHNSSTKNNNQQERERERERDEERVLCRACDKPLTLIIGVESTSLCYICNKWPSTYFCAPCSNGLINFFDRRCLELPKEIHYPYHPHPLTMRIRKNCNCCVCGKSCGAFNYGCDHHGCTFTMDIKCLLKEKKKFDGPITSVRKFMGLVYDL